MYAFIFILLHQKLNMKYLNKYINPYFFAMFIMSVINLLFMHYQFLLTIALEVPIFKTTPFDNFIACLLDVSVLIVATWLISIKKLRISLTITFAITLIWSLCNILYSRFFHQYIPWSSIEQVGNLTDSTVLNSMMAGFKLTDLYYIIIPILFFWLFVKSKPHDINTRSLRTSLYIWLCSIGLALASHSFYLLNSAHAFESVLTKTVFSGPKFDSMWPNWTYFHKGFFRKYVLDPLSYGGDMKLTKEQEEEIEKYYSDQSQRVTGRTAPDNVKNVIFILVESYLAVTSDLFVDGQEITPNLNQLKRDSNVFYNGHMQPNVSIGESSDGQLIYMSGLLPLHSEITVSKARKNTLIGLPAQMQKKYQDLSSLTIIPTNPTLWDQQAMTEAYGFQYLYSTLDYQKDMQVNITEDFLTDEMIFTYASKKDQSNTPPFCSLILTMSMHQPYDSYVEHGFHLTDKTLPQEYKNYLMSCHYTDIQIGNYLKSLKEKDLYDNSLIIIAADHDAHQDYLGMEGKIARDIPLFIVNGGLDNSNAWTGACNQLDVYTTILDIMGVECQWRGLGHTLLTNDYQNSVTEEAQQLSDWIIYSDYFNNKTIQ